MGESKLRETATAKLIAQHPLCALCGGLRLTATREHLPAKAIFDNKQRPDGLIIPSCNECNNSTSLSDLVTAIVSRWHFHDGEKATGDHQKLTRLLIKRRPDIRDEWLSLSDAKALKARRHLQKQGVNLPSDGGIVTIGPLTIEQLNIFSHKFVCGLFFDKIGTSIPSTGGLTATFRTKEDFYKECIPPDFLRLLPKFGALIQGKWDTKEQFSYRFDANREDKLLGCIAQLRSSLFIIGFAVGDMGQIPEEERSEYINPRMILNQNARFHKIIW